VSVGHAGGGHYGGQGGDGGQFVPGSPLSGHHSLSIGNLSNDNMTGTDYQYFNLANLADGLKINMGFRFAILFIAFAGWLYVIYWVRHHEPLANQVIGVNTCNSPTANQDRSIMAAMKNCYVLKTTPDLAPPYVPCPQTVDKPKEFTYPSFTNTNFGQAFDKVDYKIEDRTQLGPGQAISSPIAYPDLINFDQRFGMPVSSHTTIVTR